MDSVVISPLFFPSLWSLLSLLTGLSLLISSSNSSTANSEKSEWMTLSVSRESNERNHATLSLLIFLSLSPPISQRHSTRFCRVIYSDPPILTIIFSFFSSFNWLLIHELQTSLLLITTQTIGRTFLVPEIFCTFMLFFSLSLTWFFSIQITWESSPYHHYVTI